MAFNKGAFFAMAGDKCFAIVSDHLINETDNSSTAYTSKEKICQLSPHLFICSQGLCADDFQFRRIMSMRVAMYEAAEKCPMAPNVFASVASWELYSRSKHSPLQIAPIIAGLHPQTHQVFLSALDMGGCETRKKDYVAGGPAMSMIMGNCQTFWQPNLSPEELFETASQVLIQTCNCSTTSGGGGTVYVVEPDKVVIRTIKTRMD